MPYRIVSHILVSLLLVIVLCRCAKSTVPPSSAPLDKVEALSSFAKLYGYIKYFHPSDEAASIDWDLFAIYGAKRVREAKNRQELKAVLEELFLPIAPTLKIYNEGEGIKFDITSITPPNPKGYDTISWQHLGNGAEGMAHYWYKSNRLNRPGIFKPSSKPGRHPISLKGKEVTNEEVQLEFAIKHTYLSGRGYSKVILVYKGEGHQGYEMVGDFSNTDDWFNASHTFHIPSKTTDYDLYIVLMDAGKVVIDNIKISSKQEGKLIAERDFDQEVKKPGIELDPEKLKSYYTSYIDPEIGLLNTGAVVLESIQLEQEVAPLFADQNRLGEFFENEIGNGLKCQFPLALLGDRSHTYPMVDSLKFNQLKSSLKQYFDSQQPIKGTNLYVRLGNIINVWNVLEHFYPYMGIVGEDCNNILPRYLERASKDQNGTDFWFLLKTMVAELNDGHGFVDFVDKEVKALIFAPFSVDFCQGRLVVDRVATDTLAIKPGDEVLSINGVMAKDLMNNQGKLISSATPARKDYIATLDLITEMEATNLQLVVRLAEGLDTLEIAKNLDGRTYNLKVLQGKKNKRTVEKLEKGIYYLNLEKATEQQFLENIEALSHAQSIIVDGRGYPNGDAIKILSHFLTTKDTIDWLFVPKVIRPLDKSLKYSSSGWGLEPKPPHVSTKIFYLTNHKAISFSESIAAYFESLGNTVIVGQPTAGTNGDKQTFLIPGGYLVSYTGTKVLKHDGSQLHGVGILPDVPVSPTIQGIREGRDEILEKAIGLAKEAAKE